jgi:hypothetical protein
VDAVLALVLHFLTSQAPHLGFLLQKSILTQVFIQKGSIKLEYSIN